jgi:HAD superfamily phosphatase (TIGR01668 family)
MAFLDCLRPRLTVSSIYDLDLEGLWQRGIRGMILDLDNTLVPWGYAEVGEELRAWVGRARARGFRLCLSANARAGRVGEIASRLGIPGIANAGKPRRRAFRRAMEIMGTTPAQTAMVGDQVFTDVLGGNRMGLLTILVTPLGVREFFWTRLVRWPERLVLRALGVLRPTPPPLPYGHHHGGEPTG